MSVPLPTGRCTACCTPAAPCGVAFLRVPAHGFCPATLFSVAELAGRRVRSRWAPNKPVEALHCYGTTSLEHPAVQMIAMERGKFYMGTRAAAAGARASVTPGSPACCPAWAAASACFAQAHAVNPWRTPCESCWLRAEADGGCCLMQAGACRGWRCPSACSPARRPRRRARAPAWGPGVCMYRL